MVNPAQAQAKTHCKYDKTTGTVSLSRNEPMDVFDIWSFPLL